MNRTAAYAGAVVLAATAGLTQGAGTANAAAAAPCVADGEDSFKQSGDRFYFLVTLKNSCATRIRCTVNTNVTTAFGSELGSAVIILPPKSRKGPSEASHSFRVKQSSGSAIVAKKCSG